MDSPQARAPVLMLRTSPPIQDWPLSWQTRIRKPHTTSSTIPASVYQPSTSKPGVWPTRLMFTAIGTVQRLSSITLAQINTEIGAGAPHCGGYQMEMKRSALCRDRRGTERHAFDLRPDFRRNSHPIRVVPDCLPGWGFVGKRVPDQKRVLTNRSNGEMGAARAWKAHVRRERCPALSSACGRRRRVPGPVLESGWGRFSRKLGEALGDRGPMRLCGPSAPFTGQCGPS